MAGKKKTLEMRAYVWDVSLDRLREFKKIHGHCNVPPNYPKDRKLGIWVHNQRRFWKEGVLGEDRTARLSALGFEWNLQDAKWSRMFSKLEEFIGTNPGCLPSRYHGETELERWALEQRRLYREGRIDDGRKRSLEKIGFLWDVQDAVWNRMFTTLVQYERTHGNCEVPRRWPENATLGNWVVQQRFLKKRGKLYVERVTQLNRIGFLW